MFFIYILYSEKLDRYYTGSSEDVSKRLERHNSARVSATRNGIPWILKYTETFNTRQDALKRELYIKKMKSRKYIEELILKAGIGGHAAME
jgi:putative endonuclease